MFFFLHTYILIYIPWIQKLVGTTIGCRISKKYTIYRQCEKEKYSMLLIIHAYFLTHLISYWMYWRFMKLQVITYTGKNKNCHLSPTPSAYVILWHPSHSLTLYWGMELDWILLNVETERLACLLCIWEVLSPNFGLETSYPDWEFLWFSSVPPGKCRNNNLNLAMTTSFHIL
jgi:hypothetical protein